MMALTIVLSVVVVFVLWAVVRVKSNLAANVAYKRALDTILIMSKLSKNKGRSLDDMVDELRRDMLGKRS